MDRDTASNSNRKVPSDLPFYGAIFGISFMYLLLILGMLGADLWYAMTNLTWQRLGEILTDKHILSSVKLTIFTCTISAFLSLLVAIPAGYLLSRYRFFGKTFLDAVIDIPIVLPPLVVGVSLLILFNKMPPWNGPSFDQMFEKLGIKVSYNVPAVILAQFTVACAFAVRTMRNTFDQISPRAEQVALTLGCNRGRAFWSIVVPESWRGISTAGTLAWTRAMGEFGPILIFAGTVRGKTEVLSTTVFLEFSIGNLESVVVVSLLMVTIAIIILVAVRIWDKGTSVKFYND